MASVDSITQSFQKHTSFSLDGLVQILLAGVLAGIAAGAVSRVSMRVVAVMSGEPPSFSLEGTLMILVIFAILGLLAGLGYILPDRFIPAPKPWKGLGYGVFLMLLFAVPLHLVEAEGELGGLNPTIILLIFAPVFITYGVALDLFHLRLQGVPAGQPIRTIGLPWLVAFLPLTLIFVASLGTLSDYALPFPRVLRSALGSVGIRYGTILQFRSLSFFIIMTAYLGGAALLYWKRPQVRMAKLSALSLLAFGAAFFAARNIWFSLFSNETMGVALSGLFRAAGYTGLLLLLAIFPDGRFRPAWGRLLVLLGGLWALAYFSELFPGVLISPVNWPAPIPLIIFSVWILGGILAQVLRYRQADPAQKDQTRPVVLSFGVAVIALVLLAVGLSLNPGLSAWASPRLPLGALFAFAPYLLPWALIPITLAGAVLRRGLWVTGEDINP